MTAPRRPTDRQLMTVYDRVFEGTAIDPKSKIGQAHLRALRAVYDRGREDGEATAEDQRTRR